MRTLNRVRWWHTVLCYAVLLALITTVSHVSRGSSAEAGQAPAAAIASAAPTSAVPSLPQSAPAAPPAVRHSTAAARPKVVRAKVRLAGPGVVLPDSRLTPGATNPNVKQSNIYSTICVSGYTSTIRPSSSYTTALKIEQLHSGYAFHSDMQTSDYEEDHLIALELGGSPASRQNLWPEPYAGRDGARVKDTIENKLHSLVCAGAISLHTAQRAIAVNWWTAYLHYVTTSRPTARHSSTHTVVQPAPAPVQQGCTHTSSGSCIRGGQFCPQASYGQIGYDAGGTRYTCTGDGTHPHWER
jgi:hypothetical protein